VFIFLFFIFKRREAKMGRFSFIHCGDLHLGCRQFNEKERFEDFFRSFSDIIDYALENKVDYFLITGDLFHHRNVNAMTLGKAIAQLERLKEAGITVLAIEGNHDKAFYTDEDSWMNFLNRQGYMKLLKPEFPEGKILLQSYDGSKGSVYEEGDIRVVGLGYLGATTSRRIAEAAEQLRQYKTHGYTSEGPFTILMLHAAVDRLMDMDMAGITSDSLGVFSDCVDYIALGHIHSRQERPGVYNPGAPESVHIDEVRKNQEKGFYHVTVDGKDVQVEYVQSSRRPVKYFNVDITGVPAPSKIPELLIQKLDQALLPDIDGTDSAGCPTGTKPIVQVNLYGFVDFNSFAIDEGFLVEMVRERYGCLAVEVLNNVNIETCDGTVPGSGLDRLSIERNTITRMVEEEKPELGESARDFAELVLKVKDLSLSGAGEDDIIETIGRALGNLKAGEA